MITLWWKSWSGKNTVSDILSAKLGYDIISIWSIKKELAEKMWMTMLERDELWDKPENREKFDLKYEDYQKSLDPNGAVVLDGRMAFRCQPKAFNVFLNVWLEVSAERIHIADRCLNNDKTLEEVMKMTDARNQRQHRVYQELYQVDIYDINAYNLYINTNEFTALWVAAIILTAYEAWQSLIQQEK
jgi:cytidylate kinase